MRRLSELHMNPVPLDAQANVLSIDVECWHQIICRKLTARSIAPMEHCYHMTRSVLSLLKQAEVTATFFVLGCVAEHFPDLVQQIDDDGHEVATHGYSHTPITRLSSDDFRLESRRSVETLTGIIGKPVLGFRAPELSVVETTLWALDELVELGFKYDSSIFPTRWSRYGISTFPTGAVHMALQKGSLIEVPPSAITVWGRNFPVAGGGYFRILPLGWLVRAIRRINREGRPFVLYLHPYELSEEPLVCDDFPVRPQALARLRTEMRWNVFRSTIRDKLGRLVQEFRFASMREVLGDALYR
jgi:polysaccharide deacetylase family protein (PEP-CTERM system associated)